jgi:DNA-binding transcriptional regulator YiaG
MRGVPSSPVACVSCGQLRGCPADALCHSCRVKPHTAPNKRFYWTAALDGDLKLVYAAPTRKALSAGITYFQRRTGFTRIVIRTRAAFLGLTNDVRRPWSPGEVENLREMLGTCSRSQLARTLGRSDASVQRKIAQLGLSARIAEGYSKTQLAEVLGASPTTVSRWIASRKLECVGGRVPEDSVSLFLRKHPGLYSLKRVDEAWFKGLILT